MNEKFFVLKVGGSLLSKSDAQLFDFSYAYKLKQLLTKLSDSGFKFVINVGGGYLTRKYNDLLRTSGEDDTFDLHRVGIAITNLHAEILHGLFDNLAYPEVIRYQAYDQLLQREKAIPDYTDKAVVIAAASKPGGSNDLNAAQMAQVFGCHSVVSLKNVAGVFSADPRTNPSAKLLEKLTWEEYLAVIGNPTEHAPGASYPVDPLAAQFAQEHGISFKIIHGENLGNLEQLLAGRAFTGTEIAG